MKKFFAIIGLIGLVSFAPQPARSEVGFSIFISNAPPPPPVVFHRAPRFVLVPEEDVYVCDDYYTDYDIFRYSGFYYMYDDGYWYRSRYYGGPWLAIRLAYVPRQIFYVGDYGYRWRERPRYQGAYVRTWGYGERRYTSDWRRYNDTRIGTAVRRYRYDEQRAPVRTVEVSPDRGDWREGRDRRDNPDRGPGQGQRQGQGRGRGHGNGHGNGHGRGHGDD